MDDSVDQIKAVAYPLIMRVARVAAFLVQHAPTLRLRQKIWGVVSRYFGWRRFLSPCTTWFGAVINCDTSEFIQYRLFYFGQWEPNLTSFIYDRLTRNDVFIDVGANIGYFSLLASKKAKSVISIEASPTIFKLLEKNIYINDAANVVLKNVAVSDKSSKMDFFIGSNDSLGVSSAFKTDALSFEARVDCKPLHEIVGTELLRDARLIKIDVEGMEYTILKNILANLNLYHPELEICCEITPRSFEKYSVQVEDFLIELKTFGMEVYLMENDYSPIAYIPGMPKARPIPLTFIPTEQVDVIIRRKNDISSSTTECFR